MCYYYYNLIQCVLLDTWNYSKPSYYMQTISHFLCRLHLRTNNNTNSKNICKKLLWKKIIEIIYQNYLFKKN